MAQHPLFLRFGELYRGGQYQQAIEVLAELEKRLPGAPQVAWHRANCLEKLERYDEVAGELDRVLARAPDYAPAIIKRVRYTADGEDLEADEEHGALSEVEQMQRAAERAERALQASRHAEAELRRALEIQPDNVDGLALLASVLRDREDDALGSVRAESDALLDRAIELAPDRVDLIETRANALRSDALRDLRDLPDESGAAEHRAAPVDEGELVRTWSGMCYHRPTLERVLDDYARCLALTDHHRYAVRMGMVLHDLQRFDEALQRYDHALERMQADDPLREHITELRSRSEQGGAGEREQMAQLLEQSVSGDGEDRSLQDDIAAQAVLGAADAIRRGRPLSEALESRLSDDPDTMMAINIAQQILNAAHEPPPELAEVEPSGYPAYQRRYVEKIGREIAPLGLDYIGDAEAVGLFPMLGQHVLIRFYADEEGEVGIAAFALQAKWPGWLAYLKLRLARQWKTHGMLECVSQFSDGTHLSTQLANPSPFRYADAVQIETLPAGTPASELVARHLQRHAEYKSTHPGVSALVAHDIEGMDLRWREGQKVKRDYRMSIGYITDDELQQLLGEHYERLADKVREHLARLAADYASAPADVPEPAEPGESDEPTPTGLG